MTMPSSYSPEFPLGSAVRWAMIFQVILRLTATYLATVKIPACKVTLLRIWQKNNFWIVELHTLSSLLTFLQEKCVFLQANTQKAEKRITGSRFFNLSS